MATTKVTGGYAVVLLVAGVGLLGFRDPNGIRPLVFGCGTATTNTTTTNTAPNMPTTTTAVLSSESVAIDALGLKLVRDVAPGEAVLIDLKGQVGRTELLACFILITKFHIFFCHRPTFTIVFRFTRFRAPLPPQNSHLASLSTSSGFILYESYLLFSLETERKRFFRVLYY
jgi:hypothetical protein